jgi:hypothetical protein
MEVMIHPETSENWYGKERGRERERGIPASIMSDPTDVKKGNR